MERLFSQCFSKLTLSLADQKTYVIAQEDNKIEVEICDWNGKVVYLAYVLCILKYSGFLWVVPTNTGIFLRGFKLCKESTTQQVLLASKMRIGGNHAFFRGNKASIWKKRHRLLCILQLFRIIVAKLSQKNARLSPIFFLDFNGPC